MGATVYGAKYDANLSAVQVAARVRSEIKAAVKAGALPAGRYSVRSGRSTHTARVDIVASGLAIPVYNAGRLICDRDCLYSYGLPWMSPEGLALSETLEAMLRAYNRDASDSHADYYNVAFFSSVRIEGDREAEMARLPAKGSTEAKALVAGSWLEMKQPIYEMMEQAKP